jgi:hypothetical protein
MVMEKYAALMSMHFPVLDPILLCCIKLCTNMSATQNENSQIVLHVLSVYRLPIHLCIFLLLMRNGGCELMAVSHMS